MTKAIIFAIIIIENQIGDKTMDSKYKIVNNNGDGVYEVICPKSNIHYYVNEQKRTVAAVMDNARQELINELRSINSKFNILYWFHKEFINLIDTNMKSTYKGKSYCQPEDKFNLELGMKIAREHMLAKYYVDKAIAYNACLQKVEELYDIVRYRAEWTAERAFHFIDIASNHYAAAESNK